MEKYFQYVFFQMLRSCVLMGVFGLLFVMVRSGCIIHICIQNVFCCNVLRNI